MPGPRRGVDLARNVPGPQACPAQASGGPQPKPRVYVGRG
jgi:hypothetical protein